MVAVTLMAFTDPDTAAADGRRCKCLRHKRSFPRSPTYRSSRLALFLEWAAPRQPLAVNVINLFGGAVQSCSVCK